MGTDSRILAWRIPWTEEPGTDHGVTKSRTFSAQGMREVEGEEKEESYLSNKTNWITSFICLKI